MKKLAIFLTLTSLLFARENPFKSIVFESDIDMSNAPNLPKAKYLTKEQINLPSSSRFVESITVKYKNVDGTIGSKELLVKKDIDWHNPLIITHNTGKSQLLSNNLISKELAIVPPPLINSKDEITSKKLKTLDIFSFLKIDLYKNRVFIKTKDLKLRDFVLTKPSKIILDFGRDDTPKTKKIKVKDSFFKEIVVGRHKDFYRVALELDGKYSHHIEKKDGGYLIEIK